MRLIGYALLAAAGWWALDALATHQVTWPIFVVAMPLTAGALGALGVASLAHPFVARLTPDHGLLRLLRGLFRLGGAALLVGYVAALVVVLDKRLGRCEIAVRASQIVAIEDLWGPAGRVLSTARLVLRAWDGHGTVTVPLPPGERGRYWTGQSLRLRVCPGGLGIPYVWRFVVDAAPEYERVVRDNPAAREARRRLAFEHMEARRFRDASAAVWDYLTEHPEDVSYADQYGRWLANYRQFELALPLLRWQVERTGARRAYYYLGLTLSAAGEEADADETLRAGLARYPDAEDLRYLLAAQRRLPAAG